MFIHLQPSLIYAGKVGAHLSGALTGLHSMEKKLLALPTNISLEQKCLITVVKVLQYRGQWYKSLNGRNYEFS